MKTRSQWERLCLSVALAGGNIAGILSAVPALFVTLGLLKWLPLWSHDMQRVGYIILLASIAVLVRSPKRLIYWVLVPALFWLLWNIVGSLVKHNWPSVIHDLQGSFVSIGIALTVICGAALLTGKYGQGRETPNKEGKAYSEPSEGVWPPAPKQP